MKLHPVSPLLEDCLAALPGPPTQRVRPEAAIGRVLAAPLHAAVAVPPSRLALRPGLAVESDRLLGASPQSPVMVMERPAAVAMGETLPAGCDAIIDPDSLADHGSFLEVTESPVPGLHLRLPGSDLAAGGMIAAAGARLSAEQALAARLAGMSGVEIYDLTASLSGFETPLKDTLTTWLGRLGFRPALPGGTATLAIAAALSAPRLALQPGEGGWISVAGPQVQLAVPPRFDAALGLVLGLLAPLVMRWTAARPVLRSGRLIRKISIAQGVASTVLLKAEPEGLAPVALGDITLASLATADHFLVIPPGVEGFATGETITTCRLDPLLAS